MVRGEGLTEGYGRLKPGTFGHETIINAETLQCSVDIGAERIRSGPAYQGGAFSETRRRHRDVRGTAAKKLLEEFDVDETSVLGGIEIDADATHRDDVEGLAHFTASATGPAPLESDGLRPCELVGENPVQDSLSALRA